MLPTIGYNKGMTKDDFKLDVLAKLRDERTDTVDNIDPKKFISTGCYALNRMITEDYSKGLPIGVLVQFKGESSSGKSLFASVLLGAAQKQGCYVKLIDTENTYSKEFGERLGVDSGKMLYSTATTLEEAFEDVEQTIDKIRKLDKETPIIIALDSLSVLPTREEYGRPDLSEMKNTDGARANIVYNKILRRLCSKLASNDATLIVINQVRTDIMSKYGNDKDASGGRALKFYLSVDVKTIASKSTHLFDSNKKPIGIAGKLRLEKNKIKPALIECDFRAFYDRGLDPYFGLTDYLVQDGYITKSSAGRTSIGDLKFAKAKFTSILLDFSYTEPKLEEIRTLLGLTKENVDSRFLIDPDSEESTGESND